MLSKAWGRFRTPFFLVTFFKKFYQKQVVGPSCSRGMGVEVVDGPLVRWFAQGSLDKLL